jgi:nicotinate-nucleotide adenylyltransferase
LNFLLQEKRKTETVIGILGGTFNPIHRGHIELAKYAHEQFHIPRILVMPSGNPSSYKDISMIASSSHRCNMILAAIKPYPYMELSTIETQRSGYTYTSDTLKQLVGLYNEIYFIIGADSLYAIEQWHEATYVMTHCHLLVANRDKHRTSELTACINHLESSYHAVISMMNLSDQPYSSTTIRNRVASGQTISDMVAEEVREYIDFHHLYKNEFTNHE